MLANEKSRRRPRLNFVPVANCLTSIGERCRCQRLRQCASEGREQRPERARIPEGRHSRSYRSRGTTQRTPSIATTAPDLPTTARRRAERTVSCRRDSQKRLCFLPSKAQVGRVGLRVLIRGSRANPASVRSRPGTLAIGGFRPIGLAGASPRCEVPSSRRARTRPYWRYPAWSRIRRASDMLPCAVRLAEDQPPAHRRGAVASESTVVPPVDARAANPARLAEVVLYPLVCSPPVPPGEPPARLVRRILRRDAVVHRIHGVVDEAVRGCRSGKGRDRRALAPAGVVGTQTIISAGPRLAFA